LTWLAHHQGAIPDSARDTAEGLWYSTAGARVNWGLPHTAAPQPLLPYCMQLPAGKSKHSCKARMFVDAVTVRHAISLRTSVHMQVQQKHGARQQVQLTFQ
jgi:hypothetical protein